MHFLLSLFAKLPLAFLQKIGTMLGALMFYCVPSVRNRTKENLKQAGLEDQKLAYLVCKNAGRQILESIWIWYRPSQDVVRNISVAPHCQEMVDRALRQNRPIVFLTPHIGCFEILPVWFAHTYWERTGRNISILYRPPHKEFLQKIVGQARQAPGIEACPTTIVGVKQVIRNLRKGHTFGALPDQVPSMGDGVWVDFFGRKAYTMTLPVRVSYQFDAIRLVMWGYKEKDLWVIDGIQWDRPLTGDLIEDVQCMSHVIRYVVKQKPEQYAWNYNRYKIPRGAIPCEDRKKES